MLRGSVFYFYPGSLSRLSVDEIGFNMQMSLSQMQSVMIFSWLISVPECLSLLALISVIVCVKSAAAQLSCCLWSNFQMQNEWKSRLIASHHSSLL